ERLDRGGGGVERPGGERVGGEVLAGVERHAVGALDVSCCRAAHRDRRTGDGGRSGQGAQSQDRAGPAFRRDVV
ncbi:MAG: hypothetical protein AVDCRST_MAG66-770, partial [uncultured Pseudonocardia sp.]